MESNDIIKALEYCKDCSANLNVEIIDLITRQQTEIERLRKEVNLVSIQFQDLQERYEEAQAEIERLKSANDEKFRQWDMLAEKTKQHYADLYEEAKDILKAEAYKEFAEKLKEKLGDCHIVSDGEYCGFNCGDIHECVDTLIKAMVGEKE